MKTPFKHPRGGIKDRLAISFSGGRTSAMMTKILLDEFADTKDILITFANTGLEHEKTLDFIDQCDREMFDGRVVWLEAVVHRGERKGTTHKVVDYQTASRDGQPLTDVAEKYGIPNQTFGSCNREAKINVMRSYLRSHGWGPRDYSTAVGIRNDEVDRVSVPSMKNGVFYPCIDNGITKKEVEEFWQAQSFRLEIPEHYGNCVGCFKKSRRKLLTIAQDDESFFDWHAKIEKMAAEGRMDVDASNRKFFRGQLDSRELIDMAREGNFERFVDGKFLAFDDEMDVGGGCGASCEIGADGCELITEEDCF